ncbi:hypothetical protein [Luteimonas sp. FCS-9]|uniref:hypothetical protein n=1 Tax=Luteimonas sp. FCS-9 TaxID=1547516 RepID=UPI000A651A14|nr:hypothetical protein [Luteimonas sp. FCS-9]
MIDNAPVRSVVFRVYFAWWLRWYLGSVALMSALTGLNPDMDKVGFWAGRAVRVKEVRQ